jgi:hypothetical protein
MSRISVNNTTLKVSRLLKSQALRRLTLGRRRMLFEELEPRRVLATVVWDGEAGNGLWTTPANWSTNSVPSALDDVIIDLTPTTEVRLRGTVPVVKSLTNYGILFLEGRTDTGLASLTLDADSINFGTIKMEATSNDSSNRGSYLQTRGVAKLTNSATGIIRVGTGDGGTISGVFQNEGTIQALPLMRLSFPGTTVTHASGSLAVDPTGEILQTGGSFTFTGGSTTGTVRLQGTRVDVASTVTTPSTLQIVGDNNVLGSNLSAHVTLWLEGSTSYEFSRLYVDQDATNHGSIRLESSSNDSGNQSSYLTTRNGAKLNIGATGFIDVRPGAGDLRILTGNFVNDGHILVASGTELFQGAGSFTFTGGGSTGNFRLQNVKIDVGPGVTQPSTLKIVGDGNVLGNNLSPAVTLWLEGNPTYGFSRMLVDADAINSGVLLMEASSNDSFDRGSYLVTRGVAKLINAATGVIRVGTGDGGTISGVFRNEGAIQVLPSMRLSFPGTTVTHASGSLAVDPTGEILQTGGSFNFTGGSTTGTVRLRGTRVDVASTVTTPSTLQIVGDNNV